MVDPLLFIGLSGIEGSSGGSLDRSCFLFVGGIIDLSINVENNLNASLGQHLHDTRRKDEAPIALVEEYAAEYVHFQFPAETLPNLQVAGDCRKQSCDLFLNLRRLRQTTFELPNACAGSPMVTLVGDNIALASRPCRLATKKQCHLLRHESIAEQTQ